MASEFGRGAQVRLDGDGRQYARGGTALRLIDNIREKLEEESAGSIADGNTPDGSTRTGTPAEDEVFAPGGGLVTSIADEATARIAGDAVNAAVLATKASVTHTHTTADITALDTALAGKAATSHTHATSDVTGLVTALAGKAATSHVHATGDVTGLDAALAGKAAVSHAHIVTDVTGLQSALDGKAAATHTHAISDVTGLQTALDGKAATTHTHGITDLTATGTRDATTYLRGDNTWAVPAGGGGGAPLNNSTTADPAASDDTSQGYSVGSVWINTATDKIFHCASAALAAAAWVPSGALGHPGYVSGKFYALQEGPTVAVAVIVDIISLMQFTLREAVTISSLYLQVTTGGASSAAKMAIWASAAGRPAGLPLLGNNTGVSTTSTGAKSQATASVRLTPGVYWAGAKFTGTPPSVLGTSETSNIYSIHYFGANSASLSGSTSIAAADAYANNIMLANMTTLTPTAGSNIIIGMGVA